MDPQACLDMAQDFYTDDVYADALSSLADYFKWRLEGGFEPPNGDQFALRLLVEIGETIN